MIERVRRDKVGAALLRRCSITEVQLDTIMASLNGENLDVRRSLRDKKIVSRGAFVRTLRQGQANIEASIYTLMLLCYLNIIPKEKVQQLTRTIQLISRVGEIGTDADDVEKLIVGVEEFARNFSGRVKHG